MKASDAREMAVRRRLERQADDGTLVFQVKAEVLDMIRDSANQGYLSIDDPFKRIKRSDIAPELKQLVLELLVNDGYTYNYVLGMRPPDAVTIQVLHIYW